MSRSYFSRDPEVTLEIPDDQSLADLDTQMIPMMESVFGKKLKDYKAVKSSDFCGEAYIGPHYVDESFIYSNEFYSCSKVNLNFVDGSKVQIRFTVDELNIWDPSTGKLLESGLIIKFPMPGAPLYSREVVSRYDYLTRKLHYHQGDVIACDEGRSKTEIDSFAIISREGEASSYFVTIASIESMTEIYQGCKVTSKDKLVCESTIGSVEIEIVRSILPEPEEFRFKFKRFDISGKVSETDSLTLTCLQ